MKLFFIFVILALTSSLGHSASPIKTPYYASIKVDEANVRTGPSIKYPIQWVYQKERWPVKVVATFEGWRKITDQFGDAGWIHETLINRRRNVVVNSRGVQEVYRLPITTSNVQFIAEKGVLAKLISCKSNWCKIKASGNKGWIQSAHLWGVDEDEVYE